MKIKMIIYCNHLPIKKLRAKPKVYIYVFLPVLYQPF